MYCSVFRSSVQIIKKKQKAKAMSTRPDPLSGIRESAREEGNADTDNDTSSADPLEGLPRQPSTISIGRVRRLDSEIADNLQVFGDAYASRLSFWKSFLVSGILGTAMGFLSFSFFW